jgi:anti-anti-sigma factor
MRRMNEGSLIIRPHGDGIVSLDLRGYVDRETVHQLDQALVRLVDDGTSAIVVNCAGLTYISSDGMGVFLSHLIRIKKASGDIKFCAMNEEARTVVEVLGLAKLLQILDTEEEALAAFRGEGAGAGAADEAEAAKLRVDLAPQEGCVAVVRLKGFIDRQTLDTLEAGLDRTLAEGHPCAVIDCAGLTYISSSGMGAFIAFRRKARAAGGDVRFSGMRDEVRTVITMLGLQNIFQIFEAEDEALASYADEGA